MTPYDLSDDGPSPDRPTLTGVVRSAPRLTTGQRLHLIEEPAYAVVVNGRGEECSDRHPGRLWIAFDNPGVGGMRILFQDDDLDGVASSTFLVTRDTSGACVRIMVGEDHVFDTGHVRGYVGRRSTVRVDWDQMFDRMA